MRKIKLPIIVLAVVGIMVADKKSNPWDAMTPRQKLSVVESTVMNYYVDSVDEKKLVEAAIKGLLSDLDPHSTYSDQEETKDLTEPLDGNFSGVGVEFNMQKDTLYVVQTIAGGPSERVGIRPGDRFVAVDDSVIAGVKKKTTQIMKMLRGPKGTEVDIKVVRRGVAEPIEFRVKRDDIPLYSIDAAYMADKTTGYIRLSRFAKTSVDELLDAMDRLKKQGMQQLILDLTDNGGGYLEVAAGIANEFLQRGEMIVYTQGRRQPRREMDADGRGGFKDGRLVVMVNQFSASASEILSGALQDWDRAVIVGRRTFGKGLVQHPLAFPDGTMIRLSIARYYTPSGRSIQKPYVQGERDNYDMDMVDRYKHGEFSSADSVRFNDSLKYTTLHTHRTVYGGGGIMPDVFVPIDTTSYSNYYRDLVAKGVLNNFVIRYVDKHRAALKSRYATDDMFISNFEVSKEMMDSLVSEAAAEKIDYDEKQFQTSEDLLRTVMKALVVRDVFGRDAYFKVFNPRDNVYQEALRIITDRQRYSSLLASPGN